MARIWGNKVLYPVPQTGNSGHFYIDRDGSVEQWVPLSRVAHHVRDLNQHTVGIELVNNGRYPNWFHSDQQLMTEDYPQKQINALINLLNQVATQLPTLKTICGHEELDTGMVASENNSDIMIRRKLDPGVLFPWDTVLGRISLKKPIDKDL
jgi:N-acetylmuramoyl-L-alanine amidase